jgi:cellulose synthase/poly-beta-1,6-N-acetylglucosamine synthase-like glycosyltransferase
MSILEALLGASAITLAPLAVNAVANGVYFRRLPRAKTPAGSGPTASLLVPARNEAARLGPLLESFKALSDAEALELVVYDDDSTDGTDRLVLAAAATDARIRLVRGTPLPDGWSGKVHALHRLSEHAQGDHLIFIDADVTLRPGAVSRTLQAMAAERLDVLSLYPEQVLGSWGEKVFVPCMVYYFHLLGSQWAVRRGMKPAVVAINGQFMAWRRGAYEAVGGYAAIKDAWLDDMTIGKVAVDAGLSVSYRPGRGLARCRMYTSFGETWNGFAKHTWDSFAQSAPVYLALHAWLFMALVTPWLLFAVVPGKFWGPPAWALMAAIALMTALTRMISCAQAGGGWWSAALHPVAMAGALANGVVSWHLARHRTSSWKGRTRQGPGVTLDPASPGLP